MSKPASADDIATLVLDRFDALPKKCKPRSPEPGSGLSVREWVPLAGIVLEGYSNNLTCFVIASF